MNTNIVLWIMAYLSLIIVFSSYHEQMMLNHKQMMEEMAKQRSVEHLRILNGLEKETPCS